MQKLFCKYVHSSFGDGSSAGSIFLSRRSGEEIAKKVIDIATELEADNLFDEMVKVNGMKIRFKVWKSSATEVLGGISGPACTAHIVLEGHMTVLAFILAEKNTVGHNSADLRLPLF